MSVCNAANPPAPCPSSEIFPTSCSAHTLGRIISMRKLSWFELVVSASHVARLTHSSQTMNERPDVHHAEF
jgi:hypothetical protein